jgi:signal transduction histidine kinase
MSNRGPRFGLRREVLILLPAAVLLLVVLSTFTLFSYRSAIALLAEERRAEAAQLAQVLAEQVAHGRAPLDGDQLRKALPAVRGAAILDSKGNPITTVGDVPAIELPQMVRPVGVGPDASLPDAVAGFAPVLNGASPQIVRVDLAAARLGGQQRSLTLLSWLVLLVNSALALLVLLYLPRLLRPYDSLLERARRIGDSTEVDEVGFLLETFDRAIDALAKRGPTVEEDMAALERTLSGSLRSGLLVLDREGQVLALNAVGAALLSTTIRDPGSPAQPLTEVLAGQPELVSLLNAAIAEGRAIQREECGVLGPEGALTVGLTVHPLRRDDGATRGHLVLFTNLTEARRHAEESRLAESLASLGELAGGVAHELRNGLATLRGYLTLIERHPGEESLADFLGEMRRESDHLQRVVEDFLAFARPGTARLDEFPVSDLIQQVVADPVLQGVAIAVRQPLPTFRIRGDQGLLLRALRNLLHNAVEAQRDINVADPVEVAAERSDRGIEITVADRGPGIRGERRESLFHPFASGRPGGVGLGLALAQRIVVLHQGRISLDDREGGGTVARVVIPFDTFVTNPHN